MKTPSHTVLDYLHSLVHRHSVTASDDGELLRRFRDGRDRDAFASLLGRHGPMVLNSARRITGDEQIAEDVFQATFLLLARKAKTIRRVEALPCWLHGVARRLAVQARRARTSRREREAQVRPPFSADPLDELTARELVAVLDEEIEKLPENQRSVLILCCLEGLSQEEAARHLGCSASAIKGRLERGRDRLRLRLQKRGLTLPAALGGTLLIAGSTSPLPAALAQTTLQAATTGGSTSPEVAALIQEAMQMMFVSKFKAFGAAVMIVALAGTGAAMLALRPQAAPENEPRVIANDKPLSPNKITDLYGDPLPEGVVMRLGTLRRRAVGATLAVRADGNSIISVRAGKGIRIWDARTGELRQSRELPGEAWGPAVLSQDGRWLARVVLGGLNRRLEILEVPTGKKLRELAIEGNSYIRPVAFSADGKRVAAVGSRRATNAAGGGYAEDHLIRAWVMETGKEIFAAEVRSNGSSGPLAFAPDGTRILASFNSPDFGTYCWDIATGHRLWQNKEFRPQEFVFVPGGKMLSPNPRQAVDLETGQIVNLAQLPPFDPDTSSWTIAPDGRTLLLANSKGVTVWDLKEGKELRTLVGAGEEVVVTPEGKAAITNNGALQRWDLSTGKAVWSDTSELGHVGEVASVQFSADGKRLVSASTDGTVRLWDAKTGHPLRVWRGHQGKRPVPVMSWSEAGIKTLDLSADGRRVVSAGTDECLKLWDIASNREIRTIPLPRAENGEWGRRFYHVRISPDGRLVAGIFGPRGGEFVAGQPRPKLTDKFARWDAETGNLLEIHAVEKCSGGVFSPDGRALLAGNQLIDVWSGKKIAELPGLGNSGLGHTGGFSCDAALIVGQATKEWREKGINHVGSDGLRLWEATTGKVVARLKTGYPWVAQTVFHPDNCYIAANDLNGIHIRDVRSGEVVARFRMPESIRAGTTRGSFAGCLAFSRDGRRMATGMPDGTILLWDVPLPPSNPQPLEGKDLESLWTDLADADAAKAWQAVWRLADAPHDALAFLHGRVQPYPTATADVTGKLLADLDSESFEVREAAEKRLRKLGLQAEPALRAALNDKPSLEKRRRMESILSALSEMPEKSSSQDLRLLRALIVLERIGTPEARRLLEKAANGPASARLTRQARACLACLN